MNDTVQALSRLNAQLLAVAKQLEVVDNPSDAAAVQSTGTEGDPYARRLLIAKAWQRASSVRRDNFADSEALFADPAWELLLDLYIEGARGRPISVSSACIAAKVPTTTGWRWLVRMEHLGLIKRTHDVLDKRRSYISLTTDGRDRIERSLDAASESDRRLGIGRVEQVQRGGAT